VMERSELANICIVISMFNILMQIYYFISDCPKGEDEADCSNFKCPSEKFTCSNSTSGRRCINGKLLYQSIKFDLHF